MLEIFAKFRSIPFLSNASPFSVIKLIQLYDLLHVVSCDALHHPFGLKVAPHFNFLSIFILPIIVKNIHLNGDCVTD